MAGVGSASPREEVQKYEVKVTQEAIDILIDEGVLATGSGVTMFDIQQAIVTKEEQGEVTSSNNTQLDALGDNQIGTTRIVNGENRSSGSGVGIGQWVGTFSGSADFFRTGSGFEVLHTTFFSGALSASAFEVGCLGSVDYGRVFIGAPDDITHTSSLGTTPAGQGLIPMSFSGSFVGADSFHTAESGSASGSRIIGGATSSNQDIPGGTYNAKWISGSFPGGTYYTSSAVTVQDINNLSQSNFIGSVCVASGGFEGASSFATMHNNQPIFNGGSSLDATIEIALFVKSRIGSTFFRNSGSFSDNDNTGAALLGLTGGTLFALAVSGSGATVVSGSIESIANGGFSNRGPGKPYVGGTAKKSYFKTQRTVKVTGQIDKFQKAARKAAATAKFSPKS
tara:strand:+ start:7437 stop:8624 length:1188 start_codon:yes stop_codon:yes gene_type:complete